MTGCRRIDQEHRLVYRVEAQRVFFLGGSVPLLKPGHNAIIGAHHGGKMHPRGTICANSLSA